MGSDQRAAERMRRYRERRRASGRQETRVWLTPAEARAVRALVDRGEDPMTLATTLARLDERVVRAERNAAMHQGRAQRLEARAATADQWRRRAEAAEAELAQWRTKAVLFDD